MLGIGPAEPLRPSPADPDAGLGRIGAVRPVTLDALVQRVATAFGGTVTYAGDPWTRLERVACCTGSGGSMIGDARDGGADAFVTSDLKYHDADRAEGLPLVQLSHARAERLAMKRWAKTLERTLAPENVEVRFAQADTDPWQSA